eukprot:COSAG05_NODE_10854_length_542_cov_1.194131_1_plen_32_part_10
MHMRLVYVCFNLDRDVPTLLFLVRLQAPTKLN